MHKMATCFNPSINESSFIFPAIKPPNSDSIKDAWKNNRRDWDEVSIGFINDIPLVDV